MIKISNSAKSYLRCLARGPKSFPTWALILEEIIYYEELVNLKYACKVLDHRGTTYEITELGRKHV